MEQAFKFGDECTVIAAVTNFKKPSKKSETNVLIPAGEKVTIVSASSNMAFIRYKKETFSTRIENLNCKIPVQ